MGRFLDYFLGKDGTRRFIIMRKDSDAGEAGRALEELRSSLFNDLRTSEAAKRQQQRLCGPSVALTFNFVVSVAIIMANKLVMGKVGFNYPTFLTLIHYTSAWFLLAIFKAMSLLPVSPPSKSTPFSSLFALGAIMSFSTGLDNISLKHHSVGFYQMAKIAVTPTIVLFLAVVSVGVAVATVTDLEFNFFGACIALGWIVRSAIHKILWLMWKTTPITIFFLLALMPWLDPPGVLSFAWDINNTSAIAIFSSPWFSTSMVWSFGTWVRFFSLISNAHSTIYLANSGRFYFLPTFATSHVVLGQFKTCVILFGGYLIFSSDPGVLSICGAVTALCGMSVYTSLNLQEAKKSSKLLPKQNSSLIKTKSNVAGASLEKLEVKSDTTETVV
ncbi:hypothetical protein MKX01_020005 [Papaver californicum]|nr:hypothetical protein MKX01_020005 [Papaver californicum]